MQTLENLNIKIIFLITVLASCTVFTVPEAFSEPGGSHSHDYNYLHFSHPLITESPSPDSKLRFDYFFFDVDTEEEKSKDHTLRLEAEYAFNRNISVEADIPYTFRDFYDESGENNLDNIEVGVKLASFILERYGILVGGGLELGLPTGDDDKGIGNDHIFEIEPFTSFGYKRGVWEFVSFVSFGFPVNEDDGEDESNEFAYNGSLLMHATESIELLIEIDGEVALDGEEEGESVWNISPGIKVAPLENKRLQLGFGAGFPVTSDEEFDTRLIASAFYHF